MRGCCNGSDSDLHSDRRGSIPLPRTKFMSQTEKVQYCGGCKQQVPEFCKCDFKDRWVKSSVGGWIIGAPQWLKDQMEALKKLPPPTLEQVHAQFEASKKFRRDNARCRRHADYDKQNPPTTNCYGCWSAYTDFHQTNEAVNLFWQAMDKYGSMEGE